MSGSTKLITEPFTLTKEAAFIGSRNALFESLWQKQQNNLQARPKVSIEVTLPDGKKVDGLAWQTTPRDIASGIAKGLANSSVAAKVLHIEPLPADTTEAVVDADEVLEVNAECAEAPDAAKWQLWDMTRPLEASCHLQLLKFDDEEGRHVFWHSAAHVLGQCAEAEYGGLMTIGPALERGFYYDTYIGEHAHFNQDHYDAINAHAARIAKESQPFERLVVSRDEALELFKDNPFKIQLIESKIPPNANTTCYRNGPFVDLCRGPHLPSTSHIKAFSVERHSSAYWLGDALNDSLQRIYAIAFPDLKLLKEHRRIIEEAKKRDHRVLGNTLNLYFFDHNLSPGSAFWLPDGTKIYNKLCSFIRAEYRIRGFTEVITPNIYSVDLFKISGHYQNYKENMYMFDIEGKKWGMKPMNCPGHCLAFRHMNPSYKQLPLRMADFGVLHRNELSGSLTGLTRVRRFQQDDAHIFLRMDQVRDEVADALNFLFYVYGLLGFDFELNLATRPKKAIGCPEVWTAAETKLKEALNDSGHKWRLNEGDGAFYGPKIDIRIQDALRRYHQCGTIQLDFQMPLRFNLHYRNEAVIAAAPTNKTDVDKTTGEATDATMQESAKDSQGHDQTIPQSSKDDQGVDPSWEQPLKPGYDRPVMVHRAVLGSVERMCAVIVEHTGGKFPFWVSPRQAMVCPISEANNHYAMWIRNSLQRFGYDVCIDDSNRTINKKIREAQLDQWNFILCVGAREEASMSVTVREREDPTNQYVLTVGEVIEKFGELNSPTSVKLNQLLTYVPKASTFTDDSAPPPAAVSIPPTQTSCCNENLMSKLSEARADIEKVTTKSLCEMRGLQNEIEHLKSELKGLQEKQKAYAAPAAAVSLNSSPDVIRPPRRPSGAIGDVV